LLFAVFAFIFAALGGGAGGRVGRESSSIRRLSARRLALCGATSRCLHDGESGFRTKPLREVAVMTVVVVLIFAGADDGAARRDAAFRSASCGGLFTSMRRLEPAFLAHSIA
jgi:hypothetical protein